MVVEPASLLVFVPPTFSSVSPSPRVDVPILLCLSSSFVASTVDAARFLCLSLNVFYSFSLSFSLSFPKTVRDGMIVLFVNVSRFARDRNSVRSLRLRGRSCTNCRDLSFSINNFSLGHCLPLSYFST